MSFFIVYGGTPDEDAFGHFLSYKHSEIDLPSPIKHMLYQVICLHLNYHQKWLYKYCCFMVLVTQTTG